jgi:GTPase SAR1 family protein
MANAAASTNSATAGQGFMENLEQVGQQRQAATAQLGKIIRLLQTAEVEGEQASGALELGEEIKTLCQAQARLEQGVFRLLVLGDLKRGKSTLLNALLGEQLLPADVTPCTALLTVLKYGPEKQVTVYFNDDQPSEVLDFEAFKQRYSISPDEAKRLAEESDLAFPNVSHAVVEHPLALLQQGIEIIDTPGLNDTEARNQKVLEFVQSCHAILFVLSATQPYTLDEQRYLQNYLREPGLGLFFLINGWDRIKDGLVDGENGTELKAAEDRLRQVFQTNLADYCAVDGEDIYAHRVFEISALQALRRRIKDVDATLEGTGIDQFLAELGRYLAQDRAQVEMKRAGVVADQVQQRLGEAIARRIPLLGSDQGRLKQQIAELEVEFEQLEAIRRQCHKLVQQAGQPQAEKTGQSFKDFVLKLEETFERDFVASQPSLDFLQFLQKDNRQKFYQDFRRAFERYIRDRFATWEFTAKQDLRRSISELNHQLDEQAAAYADVLGVIDQKLLGDRFYAAGKTYPADQARIWVDLLGDIFGDTPDGLNRTINAFNSFWRSVFASVLSSVLISAVGYVLLMLFTGGTGILLNIFMILTAGTGIIGLQAEVVRQMFLRSTKQEFAKMLPRIAEEQGPKVQAAVQDCFDSFEQTLGDRIKTDIHSRRAELNNLLRQKEAREVDKERETARLQRLEQAMAEAVAQLAA